VIAEVIKLQSSDRVGWHEDAGPFDEVVLSQLQYLAPMGMTKHKYHVAAWNTIPTKRWRMELDILTAEEVASLQGCETQHVNSLAAHHALPAIRYGRSWPG